MQMTTFPVKGCKIQAYARQMTSISAFEQEEGDLHNSLKINTSGNVIRKLDLTFCSQFRAEAEYII
jgi:hypothetical protein